MIFRVGASTKPHTASRQRKYYSIWKHGLLKNTFDCSLQAAIDSLRSGCDPHHHFDFTSHLQKSFKPVFLFVNFAPLLLQRWRKLQVCDSWSQQRQQRTSVPEAWHFRFESWSQRPPAKYWCISDPTLQEILAVNPWNSNDGFDEFWIISLLNLHVRWFWCLVCFV